MYRTLSIYVSSYSNSPVKLHHLSKIIAPSVIIKPLDKITTIVENQYILRQKSDNNRTSETGIKKGLETNSCPNNRKNSLYWTISELFCSKILLNYFCVFCFFVHLGHPNTIFSVIS